MGNFELRAALHGHLSPLFEREGILFEKRILTLVSTNFGQSEKFRIMNILNQKLETNSGQT